VQGGATEPAPPPLSFQMTKEPLAATSAMTAMTWTPPAGLTMTERAIRLG
jgi:hypothetical protein